MNDDTTNNTPKQLPLLFPPEYIEIELSKSGKYKGIYKAIIDIVDADLAELRWNVDIGSHTQYVVRTDLEGKTPHGLKLHRVILARMIGRPLLKGETVDHINRNGLDNRRENLRLATRTQNVANQGIRKNSKSGYKGITWDWRKKKWKSTIMIHGKNIFLGYHATPELAHAAYCRKADELFGEFANYGDE